MDSFGMWSLHHASVIVAISAKVSVSISESSVIFGTTDLMFVFTTTGRSHFFRWDLYIGITPGNNWLLGERWQTRRCNYWYITSLVGISTAASVGGSVECHPCITCRSL